ncbi:uncharacterized protein LOC107416357 [Ziziphus jujuba]|uniref:Uncharacterized protein LOC107416357 n=1 Tax=Ziziphus jujuba TaxID=326968 RepID=A0A6P4A350_ZIZJJ|nr:uncharacterized protein LOC107416357 [Ziziphus jujuba]
MGVEQGDVVMIKNVNLVKGSYIKMQPHTTDFVHLSDPKSVLESALIRGFTCSSAGDTIMIMHEEPEKVKPADKVIEKASMEVGKKEKQVVAADDEEPKFRPFIGVAKRLDGSPVLTSVSASEECKQTSVVGRKAGKVVFGFSNAVGKPSEESKKVDDKRIIMEKKKEEKVGFQAFTGKSYRLGTE